MALSSSRRPNPASSPKPVEPTPAPPASTPAESGGLSDADEISKLLSALGDAEVAPPPPEATPAPVSLGKPNDSVDFVIPAGPGGATRPLGAILSAPEEMSVSDMDFILPDLKPDLKPDVGGAAKEPPIVKLAPSADTVRLSPAAFAPRPGTGAVRLGSRGVESQKSKVESPGGPGVVPAATDPAKPAKPGTVRLGGPGVVPAATDPAKPAKPGTVRLGGPGIVPAATDPAKPATVRLGGKGVESPGGPVATAAAKTGKHGTVRLTGNQTEAAKTGKHGTVRLTGNQTEAAKTDKHGTVRLTGNQTDAAKTASPAPASATQAAPAPAKDGKAAPKEKKQRRRKAPRPQRHRSGQDPWASVVFVILVILVVLLYVGFFIVRPKIIAARSATQSAPATVETAKPAARKPVAKPKPMGQVKPSGTTVPSAKPQKTPTGKTGKPEGTKDAQTPLATATAKVPQGGVAKPAPVTDNGLGEVDVPEDDAPVEGAAVAIPVEEPVKPASKFAPPWARKDTPAQPVAEEKPKEVVIDVPAAVDVPEVREWPELKVTAVIGSGKKGSVLVNGTVVSVGEELEEGPVLKSVSRQAAVFEWDGDRRTIYVSSKNE